MIAMKLTFKLIVLCFAVSAISCEVLTSLDGHSELRTKVVKEGGLNIEVKYNNQTKLSGHIGLNITIVNSTCSSKSSCKFSGSNNVSLLIYALEHHFNVAWSTPSNTKSANQTLIDCFLLNRTELFWYGGPELLYTSWPIQDLRLDNLPLISSKLNNGAVIEPYWLNSKGGFIWVNSSVPLFVDQNHDNKGAVCFRSETKAPYLRKTSSLLYSLVAKNDSKEAHLYAVNRFLGKPSGLPDLRMVREPIWTTWGKYKADINDTSVVKFLRDIISRNFTKGQIEIDDKWEKCYGDQTFDLEGRFNNISRTVKTIHDNGFRATLWTHPFVNSDCKTPVREGLSQGYFVNSSTGTNTSSWWNGNSSYVIDFTNPLASSWFKNRLLKLQKYGIDGYKCDAGESDWLPKKPIFRRTEINAPNDFSTKYLKTCSELGNLVEVRSGCRTQNLSVFVRMLDKDSVWGRNNGLEAVVQSLLQFNMIGYTFVLPDLIGGNGYNGEVPSPELLVRWTQACTFMPSLQFSYLPWELGKAPFNTTEIVRKFVNLHERYSDVIISAMRNSSLYGTPVNPPIWWQDPSDLNALQSSDAFMVGEEILVAPILVEGATARNIYLPKGTWKDGNNGKVYQGRQRLWNYPAPIDILPYFIRLR